MFTWGDMSMNRFLFATLTDFSTLSATEITAVMACLGAGMMLGRMLLAAAATI
jgi:hypothetical protein